MATKSDIKKRNTGRSLKLISYYLLYVSIMFSCDLDIVSDITGKVGISPFYSTNLFGNVIYEAPYFYALKSNYSVYGDTGNQLFSIYRYDDSSFTEERVLTSLYSISDIVIAGGHLYYTSNSEHKIYKVADVGSIASGSLPTTPVSYAGTGTQGTVDGTGTASAQFDTPMFIATDNTTLWVLEAGGLREIDLSNAAVTTNGAAMDTSTYGTMIYANSKIYAVNATDYTVAEVDTTGPTITTWIGNSGNAGVDNGTGTAAKITFLVDMAADSDYLYFTDAIYSSGIYYYSVRKAAFADKVVTRVFGMSALSTTPPQEATGTGSDVYLYFPDGIEVLDGELYLSTQTGFFRYTP